MQRRYRTDGPEHLKVVGETEFVAAIAGGQRAGRGQGHHRGHRQPRRPHAADRPARRGARRPRGRRRRAVPWHPRRALQRRRAAGAGDTPLLIPGGAPPDKAADPDFRRGVAHLGERGLTYDTWHYHVQCADFLDLARSVPGTTMVLDHFATPVGVGPFEGRHDEIFRGWKHDMVELAACENVVLKLGGLAMPDNGFGWHLDPAARPDVDTFVAAQERWYHHAIETFGPERCMFESNFPVDKLSLDYGTYWDAMAVIAAGTASDEQAAMFAGTARRIYRLADARLRPPSRDAVVAADDMPAAEVDIDVDLVRRLVASQFPELADRRVAPLASGWDNALFRLGDDLVVRLPRRQLGVPLIEHEQRWLPDARADAAPTDPGAGPRRRRRRTATRGRGASVRTSRARRCWRSSTGAAHWPIPWPRPDGWASSSPRSTARRRTTLRTTRCAACP